MQRNISLIDPVRPFDSGEPLAFAGILAGARVFSNRLVSGLPQCGYQDLDVEILFVPRATQREGIPLPPAIGLEGKIAVDGHWAAIEESPAQPGDRASWIRRVLPFAAALQGAVTLHASAVADPTAVYAFMGATGAGKSTLSSCLASLGLRTVADDLLPCRVRHGSVAIPIDERQTFLPLRATYFLNRQDNVECVCRAQLNRADCLERLLAHGFGEVSVRKAWALQFAIYGSIARTVAAYDLVVPDVLPRLYDCALEVKALIAQEAWQASFQPAK